MKCCAAALRTTARTLMIGDVPADAGISIERGASVKAVSGICGMNRQSDADAAALLVACFPPPWAELSFNGCGCMVVSFIATSALAPWWDPHMSPVMRYQCAAFSFYSLLLAASCPGVQRARSRRREACCRGLLRAEDVPAPRRDVRAHDGQGVLLDDGEIRRGTARALSCPSSRPDALLRQVAERERLFQELNGETLGVAEGDSGPAPAGASQCTPAEVVPPRGKSAGAWSSDSLWEAA